MGDTGTDGTKSPVAGKNDMGGSTANIAKGGTGSEKGTAGGLAGNTPKEDNAWVMLTYQAQKLLSQ